MDNFKSKLMKFIEKVSKYIKKAKDGVDKYMPLIKIEIEKYAFNIKRGCKEGYIIFTENKILTSSIVILLILISITATNNNVNKLKTLSGVQIAVKGEGKEEEIIGVVSAKNFTSEEDISNKVLEKVIGEEGDAKINLQKVKLQTKRVRVKDVEEFKQYDEVVDTLVSKTGVDYEGHVLIVDGEELFYMQNKEELENVLEVIKLDYINENTTKVEFVQMTEIKPLEKNSTLELYSQKEAFDELTRDVVKEKVHVVKNGDSLWYIGWLNDLTVEELLEMNPKLNEKKVLRVGEEIKLVLSRPFLSIKTVELLTYDDIAPRDIEFIDVDTEYKTYRKTIKEGSDGTRTVTANIVKVDGYEIDIEIVEEIIHIDPVTKVVKRGTLNTPPKKAIGSFINPAKGYISSSFGTRWGKLHAGMDIAGPVGTAIVASDGGKVIRSGWGGAYGNLVVIDHQNGFQTYYAHNSRNHVKVGEMVYQGQLIASMGSTGRSTGPHVHFEVRVNGVPKNPILYLK